MSDDPYRKPRERGYRFRKELSDTFPKITWTYAFDPKHWSHCYTGAFNLMDDTGTFHLNISDEMISVYSFDHEITVRVAHSLAHEIASYLLEGVVKWKET